MVSGSALLALRSPVEEDAINWVPFLVALLATVGAATVAPLVVFGLSFVVERTVESSPPRPWASAVVAATGFSRHGSARATRIAVPVLLGVCVVGVVFSLAQTGRSADRYDKLSSVSAQYVHSDDEATPEAWRSLFGEGRLGLRSDQRWSTGPGESPSVVPVIRVSDPSRVGEFFHGDAHLPDFAGSSVISTNPRDEVGDTLDWISPEGGPVTVRVAGVWTTNKYVAHQYLVDDSSFPSPPPYPGILLARDAASAPPDSVTWDAWTTAQLRSGLTAQIVGLAAIAVPPLLIAAIALTGLVLNFAAGARRGVSSLYALGQTRLQAVSTLSISTGTAIVGAGLLCSVPLLLVRLAESRIIRGSGYAIDVDFPLTMILIVYCALTIIAIGGTILVSSQRRFLDPSA